MPTSGFPSTCASMRAIETAILIPVKDPGPTPTAMTSRSPGASPSFFRHRSMVSRMVTECDVLTSADVSTADSPAQAAIISSGEAVSITRIFNRYAPARFVIVFDGNSHMTGGQFAGRPVSPFNYGNPVVLPVRLKVKLVKLGFAAY